ncbi:hypothetical protein BJ138DRAFT_1142508 [Hygrophoropsis aurantiaca]|uniref:Uncharacterized protein n=1 Tax=Hygrophoropsis aurantiaca TaxID=72124 RepID=A0ACB8ARP7_9AGAM|nr:hypothetical protein BJ138DRAFT_1142508 [Hygrophoropsis aurantiaca]
MDQETFNVLWELSAPGSAAEKCFVRHRQTEYRGDDLKSADWLEFMPDFQYLPENEFLQDAKLAYSFSTITMNTPVYLNWLLARFLASSGTIIRGSLQHITQVIEGGASIFTGSRDLRPVDAVIACVGLGARTLGGIEDKDVYPIRGQTVLLKAPWVKFGRTMTAGDGTYTYTMPRSDGTMLVGGTRVPNDWYPIPRPEITEDILARALVLTPELAPPHIREQHTATVDDLRPIVIEPGCGLRPARKGGIRLESEWFDAPAGRKVPVVYNYGHAGYGFLSSWGSASMALEILEKAFADGAPASKTVGETTTMVNPGN